VCPPENLSHSLRLTGLALAIILNQCFVSFDSLLQIEILQRKSFLYPLPLEVRGTKGVTNPGLLPRHRTPPS